MGMLGRVRRFGTASTRALIVLALVVPPVAVATATSATPGPYADSSSSGMGTAQTGSVAPAQRAQADFMKRPPTMSPAERRALKHDLIRNSHAAPATPVGSSGPARTSPATGLLPAPPAADGNGAADGSGAPTDFNTFVANDLGAQSGLIPEPTVATNGWAALMTWNTYDAVSMDGGVNWTFFNPATTFPTAFGGLCCDQSAIYIPHFDIYVLVLQYNPDANSNNMIRIAVTQGASGLANGSWFYYDFFTPQWVGGANGSNFDQPKISFDANFFFIEATSYGATGGSYLARFPLESLSVGGGCGCNFIGPFQEFSPGLVQGAQQVMYFAAHRSTSVLRIFQWGDSTNNFYWNDINHTAYNATYPYTCPRTGGNATSDWCQRRSFGGGWAHTDRIFNMWLAPYCAGGQCVQTIGVAWDADSGSTGFGTFSWPYVQVEIVRLTDLNGDGGARSPLAQPYLAGNGFAIQYSAFSANALGGLGGTVEFGGGTSGIYESCSIVMWDQYQTDWGLMLGYYGNADPTDTLSGDYLSSRGNGGNPRTWGATCYNLQRATPTATSTSNSHQLYLSFGRAQDSPFRTLTSSAFGSGAGSVFSSPAGITGCTGTCSANYINGTTVNLSAFAGVDSTFGGWYGDCAGTACSVTMSKNRTVYPYFVDVPPTAAVQAPGALGGSVKVSFSENVSNVTTSNLLLRRVTDGVKIPGALACRQGNGTSVSCASGPVRSATLLPNQPLTPGEYYTLRLNPGSAPTKIVDAQGSQLAASDTPFRGLTQLQESNPAATFGWRTVTNASAQGGSYTTERLSGATASFDFTGTSVSWMTVTGQTQGKARVRIDGSVVATVDNSAPSTSFGVLRTYSGLSSGAHTIEIEVLGQAGAQGTGTFVSVDAFKVGATVYATPAAVYAWQELSDPDAAGGAFARSDQAGANVSFAFRGTGVTVRLMKGPNQGQFQVSIDGVPQGIVDTYAPTKKFGFGLNFGDLADGAHVIRLDVLGQKQAASSGKFVSIDRWLVE